MHQQRTEAPPAAPEAERAFVGSLFFDPSVVETVSNIVSPIDLTDPALVSIYAAILSCQQRGEAFDPVLLLRHLKHETKLGENPAAFLADLARSVPTAAHVEHYARDIREASRKRRLLEFGQSIVAHAENGKASEDIFAEAAATLEDMSRSSALVGRPVLKSIADYEKTSIEWLWHPWIPRGSLVIVDGNPGIGKTQAMLDLAARGSRGNPMPPRVCFDGGGEPFSTILMSTEDDHGSVTRPRFEAAGGDVSKLHTFGIEGRDYIESAQFPRDGKLLREAIIETGAKLVIVDPIMGHLSDDIKSHSDQDVRKCVGQLATIANETGATIAAIRHLNKSRGQDAKHRGGGSVGIIGQARAGLMVGLDPEDPDIHVLAVHKSNYAKFPKALTFTIESVGDVSKVVWGGECGLRADEIMDELQEKKDKSEACADALTEMLTGGSREQSALEAELKAMGYSLSTFKRARKMIGVKSKKHGFGKDGIWELSLPEE